MPKTTIADVRAAGYAVAFASGSISVEEKALTETRKQATPEAIAPLVEEVATSVAAMAAAKGLPTPAIVNLVAEATTRALNSFQRDRDEGVAFHERALKIAKASPDVYFVSALGDPSTPDDDVRLYVACKADGTGWDSGAQEMLDALVSPPEPE